MNKIIIIGLFFTFQTLLYAQHSDNKKVSKTLSENAKSGVMQQKPKAPLPPTPPYVGPNFMDGTSGENMYRGGPVVRVPGWVYTGDPLAEFRKAKGGIDPARLPNVLTNPWHESGTALNKGYYIPDNFTGHMPVYTEGNNWPVIGPHQPSPPHGDFEADCGVYYQNGTIIETGALTVPGEGGFYVHNKCGYSVLLSSGTYPGNEQPGQVITVINPEECKNLPCPPRDWYHVGPYPRVPELYISVAGLDPMDVPGWHWSFSPERDYGTPGFAYKFDSKYQEVGNNEYVVMPGFAKNEGYCPRTSGDPGYGVLLYRRKPPDYKKELVCITDMYIIDSTAAKAQQDMWALEGINCQVNAQQGLQAWPVEKEGVLFFYEFVTHKVAQEHLSQCTNVRSIQLQSTGVK